MAFQMLSIPLSVSLYMQTASSIKVFGGTDSLLQGEKLEETMLIKVIFSRYHCLPARVRDVLGYGLPLDDSLSFELLNIIDCAFIVEKMKSYKH